MFGQSRAHETGRNKAADRAQTARHIAVQLLALAKLARAIDLPALAYLLETAALEASAGPG